MSNSTQTTYEVKVRVKKKGSMHFSHRLGIYKFDSIVKMFHLDANKPKQAKHKAEKYGRVISCRKISATEIVDRMAIGTEAQLVAIQMINPYPDAIAMDDFIWRRKNKRAERVRNRERDNNGH